ncbi:MAG: MBL fold metallo-hydrolase [Bacteroidales bacterium]|nr:MBL fold metallo-hydrolase [Bacteroidales bacterium]
MTEVKFKSLSSGSCGNCYFLGIFGDGRHCEAGILIDAGVSPRRFTRDMQADGITLDDIGAILLTHDHMDHLRSIGSYGKRAGADIWATATLHAALACQPVTRNWIAGRARPLSPDGWTPLPGGRIQVHWFEVPHDATQTVGYAIQLDGCRFVLITDCGRMTPEALHWASLADTVVIESNYDPQMLRTGPYPPELQDRIRQGHGHLSNPECAEAIAAFRHPGLRNVFLCHLSEHNNTPQLAMEAIRRQLDDIDFRLAPLPRQTATPLMTL